MIFLKIHKQPCELKNKSSMCVLLMPSAVTLDPSGSMCVISVTEESDRKSQNEALWSCADDEQLLQHNINRDRLSNTSGHETRNITNTH